MSNDPFDSGTPKYQTAQDIYDALKTLVNAAEEIGILGEIFQDVSYDSADYYYIDKGGTLLEKFEALSDYGDKMWIMDLAIWQIDVDNFESRGLEIHDIVYEALINPDLAKRIGFKKLFIERMLNGDKSYYDEIAEEYSAELGELNRFENYGMLTTFNKVMAARGRTLYASPYPNFCYHLCEKVKNLQLQKETQLIAECRALLTAYDDFNYGIHMNHELYQGLERRYDSKMAALQASYDEKVKRLYLLAEKQGIVFEPVEDVRLLADEI